MMSCMPAPLPGPDELHARPPQNVHVMKPYAPPPQNITVNCICPGYVLTDLVKNQIDDTAKIRGIPREDVIQTVMLVDQPTRRFVDTKEIAAMVRGGMGQASGVGGGFPCGPQVA